MIQLAVNNNAVPGLIALSSATEVMLTILSALLSLGLIFLLYKSIKRENIKYLALNDKNVTVEYVVLRQLITRAMTNAKCEYALIEVTLNDVDNLEKVCGSDQIKLAVQDVIQKIKLTLPHGIKIAIMEKDRLWVYVKGKIKKEALEILLKNMITEIVKPIVLIGSLNVEFEINIAAILYEKSLGDINAIAANLELTTVASKKRGANNAVIFDRTISNISSEEYTLFTEIQQAIKNNDFRIFYQPIVQAESLECCAVEAYLRWQHPVKGIVSPDVFMPSLEHSGDINWVGMWAFETIAKQLEYWRTHNPDTKFKVNINWSISQLTNPGLGEKIRQILKKYKVQPSDFYFEIPNYKQATTIEFAARNINFFRQMGIGIAIDNLNLEVETVMELDSTEVHMLKFNRDFVHKLASDNKTIKTIAEMIARNSASKSISVVGEGVEDFKTLEIFREVGISMAQGYYISRPKAPTEAMADILLTPWKG